MVRKGVYYSQAQARAGFTLIEVLLVVAVAGILLGIALPGAKTSVERYQLASAAYGMAADIRSVQQQAVGGEADHIQVFFDPQGRYYSITRDITLIKRIEMPEGVVFFIPPGWTQYRLSFKIEGTPSRSGVFVLEGKSGARYYVRLAAVTGVVRVSSTLPPEDGGSFSW